MGGVLPAESNIGMTGTGLLGRDTSGAGKSRRMSAADARTFLDVYDISAVVAGFQPLDSDLTAIAALTTTAFGRSGLTQVDGASFRALIGAGTSSFDGVFSGHTTRDPYDRSLRRRKL